MLFVIRFFDLEWIFNTKGEAVCFGARLAILLGTPSGAGRVHMALRPKPDYRWAG